MLAPFWHPFWLKNRSKWGGGERHRGSLATTAHQIRPGVPPDPQNGRPGRPQDPKLAPTGAPSTPKDTNLDIKTQEKKRIHTVGRPSRTREAQVPKMHQTRRILQRKIEQHSVTDSAAKKLSSISSRILLRTIEQHSVTDSAAKK